MSNQETRATTGRYAPSVHYSQHAPQPISQQLHTKPSNIKESNWGETIASLADTAGKVYLKAREQDIKAEEVSRYPSLVECKLQWLEHRRWCAFLRTMGFRQTTDYEKYLLNERRNGYD